MNKEKRKPVRIIFELTMPRNNAWNGKWTGDDRKYTVAGRFKLMEGNPLFGRHYYDFGDGWTACVEVRPALPREKATNQFCGYQWMINSLIAHGKITTPEQYREQVTAKSETASTNL